jgi:hypothetical protein
MHLRGQSVGRWGTEDSGCNRAPVPEVDPAGPRTHPHPLTAPMQRQSIDSTSIRSVGYDPEEEALVVEFQSGGVYQYIRVPRAVYERLLAARSKGRYFGDFIRLQYRYEKIR